MNKADALAAVESQGHIAPGTPGWWQVWGANPTHIRPGDVVLTKTDGEIETLFIEDTYRSRSHPIRVGIVVDGGQHSIGALCPIVLLRQGTHHTLAD